MTTIENIPFTDAANVAGPSPWTDPANVLTDDTDYAARSLGLGAVSNALDCTALANGALFDGVPDEAIIQSLTIGVRRYKFGSPTVFDGQCRVLNDGTIVGPSKADTGTSWPTGATVASYEFSGEELDGMTVGELRAAGSGFRFAAAYGTGFGVVEARVEYIEIEELEFLLPPEKKTTQEVVEQIVKSLPGRDQHVHDRLYFGESPRGSVYPYVRVSFIDNRVIEHFPSTEERVTLQVDIFGDFKQGQSLISEIERDLFAWLHGKFHAIGGIRYFIRCRRRDVRSAEDRNVIRSRSDYELRFFTPKEAQ